MNKYAHTDRFFSDMSVAAHVAFLFGAYALVLLLTTTPTVDNWHYADPILKIFPNTVTLWGVPLLAASLLIVWRSVRPVQVAEMLTPLTAGIYGAATAIGLLLLIRGIVGDELPAFIPPEESTKPGYLLGMSAGLLEELVIRLTLTPVVFLVLRKRMEFHPAAVITILIAAFSFALWHEAGSLDEPFMISHFATRFMVPGVVMGLVTFYVNPIFLVSLHCTMHIVIPTLFV